MLLLTGLVPAGAHRASAQTPAIQWEPFELAVRGAEPVAAEVGRLLVPEQRGQDGSPEIRLAFVRLRTTNPSPAPPLVYLDGGPGGDGYSLARSPAYFRLFDLIRRDRDVILLSQRGTGLSRPRLTCRAEGRLPDDVLTDAATMRAALEPGLRACADQLRAQGVTLAAYTTEASADDVDAVRRALGVPTIALLGFSYGTHLGLEVMRRHPASVERAVLVGTEGPWHTLKYPRSLDAQFGRLARAARGVVPDLVGAWLALLERAAAAPLRVPVTLGKESRTALVGAEGLQWLLRRDLGDTGDWPWIPAAIAKAAGGDVSGFRPVVERRLGQIGSGVALMGMAMDCASGSSPARLAEIRAQAPSSLLGVMTNFPYPDVCEALGLPALPASFREPFASDVPTLFVRGTLDGNTPPWQADEVSARFTRDLHLTIEGAGHEGSLPAPAVQDAIVGFLQGRADLPARLAVPLPVFTPAR
ncbi:MAG: alpha/beta fold hydrolase [Vicinamibacterales bacterium]